MKTLITINLESPIVEIGLSKIYHCLRICTYVGCRQDVADWHDYPFQPHVVARSRIQAYMMWIVMKYIEILIAYGDYYFRQNTLEAIPDATQL